MSYCDLHQSVALRAFSSNFIISKRVIDWAKYFLASSLRHNSASAHALLYISRGSITKLPYLTQNATPSSQILYACSYSLLRASQLLISYTITGYLQLFVCCQALVVPCTVLTNIPILKNLSVYDFLHIVPQLH